MQASKTVRPCGGEVVRRRRALLQSNMQSDTIFALKAQYRLTSPPLLMVQSVRGLRRPQGRMARSGRPPGRVVRCRHRGRRTGRMRGERARVDPPPRVVEMFPMTGVRNW